MTARSRGAVLTRVESRRHKAAILRKGPYAVTYAIEESQVNDLPPWFSTAVLFLGILLFCVGFSLRRKAFGILLLGLGVVCMLTLIAYHVFLALQA